MIFFNPRINKVIIIIIIIIIIMIIITIIIMPSRKLRRRKQTRVNPGEYRDVVDHDEYFKNDFKSLILFKYEVRSLCSEQHWFP